MNARWTCPTGWCEVTPAPTPNCSGHRVTKDIASAADLLAWADGYDGLALAPAETHDAYYRCAYVALQDISTAKGVA